jgi:hypothetical protein
MRLCQAGAFFLLRVGFVPLNGHPQSVNMFLYLYLYLGFFLLPSHPQVRNFFYNFLVLGFPLWGGGISCDYFAIPRLGIVPSTWLSPG